MHIIHSQCYIMYEKSVVREIGYFGRFMPLHYEVKKHLKKKVWAEREAGRVFTADEEHLLRAFNLLPVRLDKECLESLAECVRNATVPDGEEWIYRIYGDVSYSDVTYFEELGETIREAVTALDCRFHVYYEAYY